MSILGLDLFRFLRDHAERVAPNQREDVLEAARQQEIADLTNRIGAFPGAWRAADALRHDHGHRDAA